MAVTRSSAVRDDVAAMEVPHYSVVMEWDAEDRIFVVSVPELPGCHTHGATYEEAARKVGPLIEDWVAALRASGQRVPAAREWQP